MSDDSTVIWAFFMIVGWMLLIADWTTDPEFPLSIFAVVFFICGLIVSKGDS